MTETIMLHPTQTDILLTNLLKGMSFYMYTQIIYSYAKYKFYIESALLRQYSQYIPDIIPNYQPVQVTCYILENEQLSYRTLIIYISNLILQKLDTIKASDIIAINDEDDVEVVKIIEKDAGEICLDNI